MNKPHKLVLFLFENALLLDISGPVQVFHGASRAGPDGAAYDIRYCSLAGGPVRTDVGVMIETVPVQDILKTGLDTLMVAGGAGVFSVYKDEAYKQAVWQLGALAKRSVSICTGAFLLAAAGLLNGRKATTHWRRCERLAEEFPAIDVQTDPIYVRDEPIWTSAGVTAGIDLSLALVEADLGRGVSLSVARELVVFLRRPGGQQQFSAALQAQTRDGSGEFDRLHGWVADNLQKTVSVSDLACEAGMSLRTFTRRYKYATGESPGDMLARLRLEAATRMLTETSLPLKRVADLAGYGAYEKMRRAFLKSVKLTPGLYRERFAGILGSGKID